MQSAILVVVMILFSIYTVSEMSRNNNTETNHYASFKAKNVAANVLQYQNLAMQYMLNNYSALHLNFSTIPGSVEQVNLIQNESLTSYTQKDFILFLNYKSVAFNYTRFENGDNQPTPLLYVATSFDNYTNGVINSYSSIKFPEIMGNLGSDLGKHLYQGNSTYWTVPWVFSQDNCNITEVYSSLPDNESGQSNLAAVESMFNLFCNEIQQDSSYKFLRYVYIQPVENPADI